MSTAHDLQRWSDLGMPGVSGWEVADLAAALARAVAGREGPGG